MMRTWEWAGVAGLGMGLLLLAVGCRTEALRLDVPDLLESAGRAPHAVVGPLIALATLASEDLACVTAGVLSGQRVLTFAEAVWWCWIGIVLGDMGLYVIGRLFGERAAEIWGLRRVLTRERLFLGERLFRRHGVTILFTSRFLPGTRMALYVAAGVVRFPAWKFAACLTAAALLWVPVLVGFSRWMGMRVLEWLGVYERYAWLGLVLAILLVWFAVELIVPLCSARGRRLLLSGWYRLTEWEFWPMWVVYLPVFARIVWLSVKHGGWTTFTAANPGIPHGGLALESKSEILVGLTGGTGREARVARWRLLGPDRLTDLEAFLADEGMDYPVVLKPDLGERGQGVAIVRDAEEAGRYAERCPPDLAVIAQEFVPGPEYGVFYVRRPGADRGEILSITRKETVAVFGDGRRTLEELILAHPRGVRSARFFLRRHAARLSWVPEEGGQVCLGELGTHCRGALFTDARDCATEALRKELDDLAERFEGFHFGRFDLKAPDETALREGRGLQVLELNGVSSESTHIYQPGYPIWRGWADLCRQWDLAFEIGAFNRDRGHRVSTGQELRALLREYRRRRVHEA